MHDPITERAVELESLEPGYRAALSYLKTTEYQQDRARTYAKIEKLVLSYSGSNSDFILGQCTALIKEINRFDEIVRTYESKKKTLRVINPPRQADSLEP